MKGLFILISLLLILNTASAISLGDLKKELEKTGDKLRIVVE